MKACIVTVYNSTNCGSFLQAYSLRYALEQLGAEVSFLETKVKNNRSIMLDKSLRYLKMRKPGRIKPEYRKYKNFKDCLKSFRLCRMNKSELSQQDIFVLGSDEIWKISDSLHFPNPFWLCGDLGARKFAYAASSRSKLSELSEEKYARLRAILDDFEYIGVRDKPTFDEISAATSDPTKVRMNPDPSFIYKYDVTDKAYLALRKKYRIPDNKKTALIMTKNKSIAKLIRNSLGKEYALVSVFHHQHGCINVGELRPFEWLSLIRYSDFVLTTYFHASCFSIIYDTPFIAFGDRNKSSKLAPLFEEFSLSDRYFPDSSQLSDLTENVKRLSSHPDRQELVEKKRIEFEEFINALRKK